MMVPLLVWPQNSKKDKEIKQRDISAWSGNKTNNRMTTVIEVTYISAESYFSFW